MKTEIISTYLLNMMVRISFDGIMQLFNGLWLYHDMTVPTQAGPQKINAVYFLEIRPVKP